MKVITECPTCGRHTTSSIEGLVFYCNPGNVKFRDKEVRLRPRQIDVFEHLVLAYPRFVNAGVIIDDLWPNTDPLEADNSLKVHICNIRKILRTAGMEIQIKNNGCGGYALEVVNNAEANAA